MIQIISAKYVNIFLYLPHLSFWSSNPKGPWAKKITIGYRLHDSLPSKSNHNNGKQALRGIEDNDLVCKNNSKQLKKLLVKYSCLSLML